MAALLVVTAGVATFEYVVGPTHEVSAAPSDDLITHWKYRVEVTQEAIPDAIAGATFSGGNTVVYNSNGDRFLTYHASIDETISSPGGVCGAWNQTYLGSGTGTGAVYFGSGGFGPDQFGLDPTEVWSALLVSPDVGYPITQATSWASCQPSSTTFDFYPQLAPVFLPGSPEELGALPVGTVLSLAYSDANAAYVMHVSYQAEKLEPPIDTDGDGLYDRDDRCPNEPGPLEAGGCPNPCDDSPDHDGDGLNACEESELGTDPGDPDSDDDAFNDGTDNCPLVAGSDQGCPTDTDGDGRTDSAEGAPAVDTDGDGTPDFQDTDSDNDGTPDSDEGDGDSDGDGTPDWRDDSGGSGGCDATAERRGYTVAHYDADLNLAAARDPDFFDWDVSAVWCVNDNRVYFDDVDSFANVTLDGNLMGAFAVLGVTFRHDPEDSANFLNPTGGTTTGSVSASTDFDVCVQLLDLVSGGAGSLIDNMSARAARTLLGQMPKNGDSMVGWLDDLALRADAATLRIDDAILQYLDRVFNKPAFRRLPGNIAPQLRILLNEAMAAVGLALRGQDPAYSLSTMADQGTMNFLDVYYDGARIVIPRRDRDAARVLWTDATERVGRAIADAIKNLVDDEPDLCMTIWRPILTMYIPQVGESFVDDSRIDASLLDVKGGIAIDERSE